MYKLLGIGLVVLLVVGAGGYYLYTRSEANSSIEAQSTATEQTSPPMSLKALLEANTSQTCVFTDATAQTGTIYMDGGKFRGDFNTQVEGQVTASHMIMDGTNAYFWMDGQVQGYKSSWASIEEVSGETTMGASSDIQSTITQEVDYACQPWVVDTSKFSVPTDVKFTDYSEMVEDLGPLMEGNAQACNACNSLSGEAKTQCKTSLRCN
jgi:hypothetical protein